MTDKNRIPVFDFGDTLVPCYRLQNLLIREELKEHGVKEIPEFKVNNFRIYTPSEVSEYMEKNGVEQIDVARVIEKYKERERRFMEQNHVFRFLRECSQEFGKIGFISDNTIEGKKWLKQQLEINDVSYKGLVVSEEVGVEKPSKEIFESFLEKRDKPAERFSYFGNNVPRDKAARKVGMEFVWVKQYNTFDTSYNGKQIDELNLENVKKVLT